MDQQDALGRGHASWRAGVLGSVEVIPWGMVDAVCEAIHVKPKAKNAWRQAVQLLVGQEGHKELVVCVDLNGVAQNII